MRKKVDSRVRGVLEEAVRKNHRAFMFMIGDNGKDQVVNLHYTMHKLTAKKPSVLWCYKKDLGFSTHDKKRAKHIKKQVQRGLYDPDTDDPFELFVTSTDIRYTYYKDTEKVLGKTFGMCVLQDFEALTPNLLCRTIETVEGGGLIIIMCKSMSSLKQLYSLTMDSHNKYRTENHTDVEPRFNERFILSLASCDNCIVVDDELNILPICESTVNAAQPVQNQELAIEDTPERAQLKELQESMKETQPVGNILNVCKTLDQARAVMQFVDMISEKNLRQTASLTAGRGRGKSAALGLSIASAVAYGYANIFVTAPSPENIGTLFEFILRGFDALGLKEHQDYELVQAEGAEFNKAVVRINVFRDHRQTIQYVDPSDAAVLAQAELLIVDEAAAIPLPTVRKLLGPYLTLLSSTVHGYEGTGRSLTLKLISELKNGSASSGSSKKMDKTDRSLKEIELDEPIRYGAGDPVEKWLFRLLCLGATTPFKLRSLSLPMPQACELYLVNRDALFSYHKASETFLGNIMSLFVSSHYKNAPNDLMTLSDAPAHQIFVLAPPVDENTPGLPDVFVAIQVALEGSLNKESMKKAFSRGQNAAGDLIPWQMAKSFLDSEFGELSGARIVRIATHQAVQRKGYAQEAVKQMVDWFENKMGCADESSSDEESDSDEEKEVEETGTGLLKEKIKPRKVPCLLKKCGSSKCPYTLDYVGTAFGVTPELFSFWQKSQFQPVWMKQLANDTTGEFSTIMLRQLESQENTQWLKNFVGDFRSRFFRLSSGCFNHMAIKLALCILDPPTPKGQAELVMSDHQLQTANDLLQLFTRQDLHRLEAYAKNMADWNFVNDLLPNVAALFFQRRMAADIRLSYGQCAVLYGLGAQRRTIDSIAKEMNLPAQQLLALLVKAIHKISQYYQRLLAKEVEVKTTKVQKQSTPAVSKSLAQEQRAGAKQFAKEHHEKLQKQTVFDVKADENAFDGVVPEPGKRVMIPRSLDAPVNDGQPVKKRKKSKKVL